MTKIKTISIPDDVDCFDKLNNITPNDMNFSEQVRFAVGVFIKSQEGNTITNYIDDKLPVLDAPIDEWINYIEKHPDKWIDIMNRAAQLKNISERRLRDNCVIR